MDLTKVVQLPDGTYNFYYVAKDLLDDSATEKDILAKANEIAKAPDTAQKMGLLSLVGEAKDEVKRRILSYANEPTQMNMTSAAAGGLFNDEQMKAYQEGLAWIAATLEKGREIALKGVKDVSDDRHWPIPSDAAIALAKAY